MVKRGLFVLLLALLLIPAVSATISFSTLSPNAYNFGDTLNASANVSASSNTNSFFIASLVCANVTEIYRAPLKILAGNQVTIPLSLKLDSSLIGNSSGECYIEAEYGPDAANSTSFEISSQLIINSNNALMNYSPGSIIALKGSVTKVNGQPFNGSIQASIPDLGLEANTNSTNGQFALSFTIPSNAESKFYAIQIFAYETDEFNQITNEGNLTISFDVPQVPTKLEMAIGSQNVTPGNYLSYQALLTDQAGNEINSSNIQFSVIRPNGSLASSKTALSSQLIEFTTSSNDAAGIWSIKALIGNISTQGLFVVLGQANATFTLVNNTLMVQNIGNVPYNKTLLVDMGNNSYSLSVDIPIGESNQFKLEAPNGQYNVVVSDGILTSSLGSATLTGNAVNVQNLQNVPGGAYIIIGWIIIILALAWGVYVLYKRSSNRTITVKKNYFSPIKLSSPSKESSSLSSTSITNGEKQNCAIIALKIRNLEEIKRSQSNAMESINLALAKARTARASVYDSNEFKTIIIPPSVTKDNQATIAAKVASDINSLLSEHNKKYSQKIDYGIGLNLGELIVEKRQNKFKFSAIGNTLQLTRRIADSAKNELLISESIRNKAMRDIKVERKGNYWTINQVKDRTANNEFINRFMKRNSNS